MYYLELIQKFWNFNRKIQLGSSTIVVYFYLLKLANDKNSYTITISDVMMSNTLGLTRKTVQSCKEKLRNIGLIQYETKNGCPCSYRVMVDYNIEIAESVIGNKHELKSISHIKTIEKSNLSLVINNVPNLIQTKEKNDDKSLKLLFGVCEIPSMEMFIEYAQSLDLYDASLEIKIKEKYFSWVGNNWKNTSNKPISNWKLSLKNSLPYMKDGDYEKNVFLEPIPSINPPKSSLD